MTRPATLAPPATAGCPPGRSPVRPVVVLVTGPSGAGRSTAMDALEDLGFEAIDNLPLSLLPRAADGARDRPLAVGLDARNRDWSPEALDPEALDPDALDRALDDALGGVDAQVLFLDCAEAALLRRYAATRRRHPLAPEGAPEGAASEAVAEGIRRERPLLEPVRARAHHVIDTTDLSPHDLRAAVRRRFGALGEGLAVSVESFSYKRGSPGGFDLALDCRFLRNPHWDEALRPLDGRDAGVAAFVEADPRYPAFFAGLRDLVGALLPAYRDDGRAHLAIGLGCTGGRHRSVAVAEGLAQALADAGWRVSKRHRELERAEAVDATSHTTSGTAT